MKTVSLRLDPITRIMLIVIAAALGIIALKQLFPTTLEANPQVMDVNIAEIFGSRYTDLPVEVTNTELQVTGPAFGLEITGSVEVSNEVDVNIAKIFGEEYGYRTYGRLPVDVD